MYKRIHLFTIEVLSNKLKQIIYTKRISVQKKHIPLINTDNQTFKQIIKTGMLI